MRSCFEMKEEFKAFKYCQGLWNYINPDKNGPTILDVPKVLKL